MTPLTWTDEAALLERARHLAGRSVESLLRWAFPNPLTPQQKCNKGLLGQALDRWLGSHLYGPGADFPDLQLELKSMPVSLKREPLESTFVTTANLRRQESWETSAVFKKLGRVLWIPYLADAELDSAHRLFLSPFLWSPSPETLCQLQNDWEELKTALETGYADHISGAQGELLQLRPKGKNRCSRTLGYNEFGEATFLGDKAFYLRSRFTRTLLARMPTAGIEPATY